MQAETLLPLGKVDPGLRAPETPLDLAAVGEDARLVEALGYDALMVEETKDDPFVIMALAAQTTTTLRLGTAVAISFPRSPTSMALSAWSIQKLSRGRFTLGLGPQVRAHIERRYGMATSPAGPWMRDYVGALRAVWDCWQNGTPLHYESEHYRLSLMVPLFNPGPIEHPEIPVHLAAVNTVMCRIAGEVADGVRPHPVCTPSYIQDVMLPAVRAGAGKTGRSLDSFSVSMKPLVASAPDEEQLVPRVRDARARIAFYASTPAYRAAFDHLGLDALADEAKLLSRAQRWDDLPALISDEVLDHFAVIGTYETMAKRLLDRFGDTVTDVEFSIPARSPAEREVLQDLVTQLRTHSQTAARSAIAGA